MRDRAKILLVDDDAGLLRLLSLRLGAGGYLVSTAESGAQALARAASFQPDIVITDLRMDGMDGMALYDSLHEKNPTLPVIILTAHGTIPDAVEATQRGIFDYLTKPFDSKALLECIERALRLAGNAANDADDGNGAWRKSIVSRSPRVEAVLRQAGLVADSDVPVLIQSESGTGKELLARALHAASRRREHAFVAVNCSAIPDTLLESELFGHAKGSFTGATQQHQGLFQAAHGGTLFLDEIADMSLPSQAKVLRVLQEREVRPVGSTKSVPIDVRIIAATRRDLEQAVADGVFREDLYYRLNVVTLELPPLAERREDIPLLAAQFLQRIRERSGKDVRGFSPEAMELLLGAPWPGNVRQLQNVIEQTVALSTTPIVPASLVQRALRQKTGDVPSLIEARGNFERDYLTQLLQMTHGNVSTTARLAHRNRTELYKLLRRYHLDPQSFRLRN
jgi:two-component system, NtrC family, response regulator GlrR